MEQFEETIKVRRLQEQNKSLIKELHAAKRTIEAWSKCRQETPPAIGRREKQTHKREAVPVLMLSDAHVEEVVDSEKVLGVNSYNEATAVARLDYLVSEYVDRVLFLSRSHTIHEGVFWIGGDLFSGHIHFELVEIVSRSPVQAVAWLHELLTEYIKRILKETKLKRLLIPCNPGNHGRTTKDRRIATNAENNFEWLLYVMLQRTFAKEKRVEFVITPAEFCTFDVLGLRCATGHGENFRPGSGNFYAALERFANGWRKWARFDLAWFGHIHTQRNTATVASNGSVIGAAPYGLSLRCDPDEASQGFLLITKDGIEISAPIRLGHIQKG